MWAGETVRHASIRTMARLHSESLVEVEMAHVSTTSGGIRQPNLSIQVCTIQVHLSTVLMNNLACLCNTIFEYTKCRRVRDLGNTLSSR